LKKNPLNGNFYAGKNIFTKNFLEKNLFISSIIEVLWTLGGTQKNFPFLRGAVAFRCPLDRCYPPPGLSESDALPGKGSSMSRD
jgi:hypothetical protein